MDEQEVTPEKRTRDFITKALREALQDKFVGTRLSRDTKDEVKNAIMHLLAQMKSDLYGYNVESVTTLWKLMTLKEKIKWFVSNRLFPSIGQKVRETVERLNMAMHELANYERPEGADEEWEADYSREKLPSWAEYSPKGSIRVKATVRPVRAIEFIPLSIQISDLQEPRT